MCFPMQVSHQLTKRFNFSILETQWKTKDSFLFSCSSTEDTPGNFSQRLHHLYTGERT